MKSYLGVDWGKKNVGIALADGETRLAFAYDTLNNNANFFEKLMKIIEEENVGAIIIGIPSHVNREETIYAGEKMGEIIKKKNKKIEVFYQNEMFTTKMAEANLIEKGIKKIKRFDDQEAARIILQGWLDENNQVYK